METFIVRFYRRARTLRHEVAGTVENVDSGERSGFAGEQQLLARLFQGADAPTKQAGDGSPPLAAASEDDH